MVTEPRENRTELVPADFEETALGPARQLVARAQQYVRASRAANTQRAYQNAVRTYEEWCAEIGATAHPATAEKVALFATALAEAGKSWSTINVALAGIDYARKMNGQDPLRPSREVSTVCEGIRRVRGTAPKKAKPITIEQLRAIADNLDDVKAGATAVRDRALLLLGFTGAFRRSELIALTLADLTRDENGFVVRLTRSKTDQFGQGTFKGIPYGGRAATCPVRALDAWLGVRVPRTGEGPAPEPTAPVFIQYSRCCPMDKPLSDQAVNRVVKARLADAGLDNTGYSGHSLRAGFVTAAARAGKRLDIIMRQTGHKNVETVMGYVRTVELFKENAAEGLGL